MRKIRPNVRGGGQLFTRPIAWLGVFGVLIALLVAIDAPASAGGYGDKCVDASPAVLTHTFKSDHTGVLTLSGSKPLCTPLYIKGAAYKYDTPPSVFPQTKTAETSVVKVDKPGPYNFNTPPTTCGQGDVYAKLGSEPVVPSTLTGPGSNNEPQFVSNFSSGPATYYQDDATKCTKPPVPPTPPAPPPVTAGTPTGYGTVNCHTAKFVTDTREPNTPPVPIVERAGKYRVVKTVAGGHLRIKKVSVKPGNIVRYREGGVLVFQATVPRCVKQPPHSGVRLPFVGR